MPFVQSTNPVYARNVVDDLLGALSARPAGAGLVTPFVHLFTAGPGVITQDFTPADFTEATFVGYAPAALTLPLVGPINADADHDGVHNEVDFLGGAVVPPGESIAGYWIDDNATTPTTQYMAEVFAVPIPIATVGDYISLDVVFALPWQESLSL